MVTLHRISALARGCRCDLSDSASLAEAVSSAVRAAGLRPMADATHAFVPHGLSIALILGESHLVLSTWPEHSAATVDLSVCANRESAMQVWEKLDDLLQADSIELTRQTVVIAG